MDSIPINKNLQPNTMKTFFKLIPAIALVIIVSMGNLMGQTPISYSYDASGNRQTRKVVTLKSGSIDQSEVTSSDSASIKPEVFQESLGETTIKIYPNPTKGELQVGITGIDNTKESFIQVFNLSGVIISEKKPLSDSNIIDLSARPTGTYLLKIYLNNKVSEWKILKE